MLAAFVHNSGILVLVLAVIAVSRCQPIEQASVLHESIPSDRHQCCYLIKRYGEATMM
jgi:hypothetical protein